jgi:hypothetical protein
MTTQQPGEGENRNRATRRGVLKAGLAAGAVAGTGAWRFAPGHGGPVKRAGLLPGPSSGSPDAAQLEPTGMAPYSVAGTTLTSGANQYEVNVTNPVPASDGLVVAIALGGANPPTVASVTDSQSNTYIPLQLGSSDSPELAVFSPAANGDFAPLSTTDSFTIALPAGITAPGGGCVIAYGVPDQPVIDVSVLSDIDSPGTTASVTGMPRQAGETALAIFAWANDGGTGQIAMGGPFTQLAQQHATNGSYLTVADAGDAAAGSSLTASYALSQSVSWFGVLLTFGTAYAGAYQVSSTSGVKGNLTYSVPIQAGSPLAPAGLPALPAGDGAVLVIAVGGASPPAAPAVTDSRGNTWTAQALTETGSPLLHVFTAGTAAAPGIGTGLNSGSSPDTLTVTFPSAPSSEPAFLIIGASMRPAVDVGVSTYASGASTSPSVSGRPANGCEVVLGLFAWANSGGKGTPTGPFTQIGQAQGGGGSYATAYYYGQALANSTQTASATIAQATWRGVMLSFQVAALNWFSNYAQIQTMYGTTQDSQDSCAGLYGPSTSMSITQDTTAADPTTTSSVPPGPGPLPTPAFDTTPILKYSSYEQLNTDLKNHGQNPNLAQFKWLEYDIENWPPPPGANTEPAAEEQNPWSYLRQFVTLAHEYGYRVMLAPALDLALVSNTLVPARNGETNSEWTIRTGILAACAAAGADIVHCQCQSQQPPWESVSTFQTLFGDLYTQAQAQSAYCLITVGLRSNSPATSSDIQSAYTSLLPQTPPAPTAQGFWMNVGSGSEATAVQFNEQIA